jgi:hypothetical protein
MKKYATNLILIVAAAAFAVGLFRLFTLRFEAGDIYPPYSSLRSDPLGTMALFESLAKMPGVNLVRDFSADNGLPDGGGTTYLHLAATRDEWVWVPEEVVKEIQAYVLEGGRLVIAFLPETSRHFSGVAPPPAPGTPPAKKPASGAKGGSASSLFKDRWGVEFGFEALQPGEGETYEAASVENRTDLPLPRSLNWHSAMIFTNVNPAWMTVYSRRTNPVVIERKFGLGSVILMSDTFCLSNEAMVQDRHPELLAWLIGQARVIEFDEAHLGLVETSGVASLMRKYRLHGLVAGILLLTGLFIWKHSVSFSPRSVDGQAPTTIAGKDAAAGFINLLRRNIASREVLRICFDEWTKSFARRGAHSIARVDQAQAVFEAEAARAKPDQDPVRAYREIRQALKGARTKHDAGHPIK